MTFGQDITTPINTVFGGIHNCCGYQKCKSVKNGTKICQKLTFKKFQKEDKTFDPRPFYEEYDCEKYFEHLIKWKINNAKKSLDKHPQLTVSPHRHKIFLQKPRSTIRG